MLNENENENDYENSLENNQTNIEEDINTGKEIKNVYIFSIKK